MGWVKGTLLVVHVLSCVFLILLILIQKDRGGGLAGAFGGGSLGTPFGIRTATVGKPAVTAFGTLAALGKIKVNGPGQKSFIRSRASFEISRATLSSSAPSSICTIKGLSAGRPLSLKIFLIAFRSNAFAPSP